MADHPTAMQLAKDAKEAREELARRLRSIDLRKHSMDLVVRLSEHMAVGDPVPLARQIYDFLEDISSKSEEPDA